MRDYFSFSNKFSMTIFLIFYDLFIMLSLIAIVFNPNPV